MVSIIGRLARIRWTAIEPAEAASLRCSPLVRSSAEARLRISDQLWGFLHDAETRLVGHAIAGEPRLAVPPPGSDGVSCRELAGGPYLVAAEVSRAAWAALARAPELEPCDIQWTTQVCTIPGIMPTALSIPNGYGREFELRWPPPESPEEQAVLSQEDALLDLATVESEDGGCAPVSRYGVLEHGAMTWLDVAFDRGSEVLPDVTRRFRERLTRFGEALATSGVWFEDVVDYASYELRHALEDACVPQGFGGGLAPIVQSVSAAEDLEERRDRALAKWDPEEDIFGSTQGFRVDLTRIPAHLETRRTTIGYLSGQIAGEKAGADEIEDAIIAAADAAGLKVSINRLDIILEMRGEDEA